MVILTEVINILHTLVDNAVPDIIHKEEHISSKQIGNLTEDKR